LKFKPDTSDVAVLKKPLLQLYHNTGEQPNKDIIKNIAVIFKIDLTENVDLNLEMIFNGRWRNHYKFSDGREESELFEIKEYNKYYINDLYDMDLDNTKIDNNGENVSFTKKRLSNNEVFHAKLQRVDANHYTGVENENIIVDYTREI